MRESSTQQVTGLDFRKEVQALMRARIREAIQITVEEELVT